MIQRVFFFRFADQVQTILNLNQLSDVNSITQFLQSQGFNSNLGSGQNIQAALNYVQTQQFSLVTILFKED